MNKSREELCCVSTVFRGLLPPPRFISNRCGHVTGPKRKQSARFRFRQFDVIFAGHLESEHGQWKMYIEKAIGGGIHTMRVVYLLSVKTYNKFNLCFIEIVT